MSHLMSLLGVKRTCRVALHMSAFDPKRTSKFEFVINRKALGLTIPAGVISIADEVIE